jgi:hypothetical protein
MATPTGINVVNPVSLRDEKIVRKLEDFPDLLEALRDCDLLTGRLFCAKLFDFDAWRKFRSSDEEEMEDFSGKNQSAASAQSD